MLFIQAVIFLRHNKNCLVKGVEAKKATVADHVLLIRL